VNYSRRSRIGFSSAAGVLLCVIFASITARAESVLDALPTLDSISSRLELSPEQEAQLRPIFQKRMSELQASQRLLDQAATPQQKSDVLRDAKQAGDAFNAQVERVLSPSQKHEWQELRAGVREKVEERAEQKRE
jgi:hypothetical protein